MVRAAGPTSPAARLAAVEVQMVVGVSVFELHIPEARSLKQKRKVVKSLLDRLYHRHRVSIAETDFHDLHQRAEISLAIVHSSSSHVEQLLENLRNLVEDNLNAQLIRWDTQVLEEV